MKRFFPIEIYSLPRVKEFLREDKVTFSVAKKVRKCLEKDRNFY